MDFIQFYKKLAKKMTPGQVFETLAEDVIEDNGSEKTFFKLDDGYVGFVIKIRTMWGAGDEDMNRLHQLICKDYPDESILNISVFGSPDVFHKTRLYKRSHSYSGSSFLNEFVADRADYMEKAAGRGIDRESGTLLRNFECVLSLKVKRTAFNAKEAVFKKEFGKLIEEVFFMAHTVGLQPILLRGNEYVKYVQTILNWHDDAFWKKESTDRRQTNYDPCRYVRDSFFEPGNDLLLHNEEEMTLGNKHVGVMSVHNYKELMCIHDMTELLGDVKKGYKGGIKGNFLFSTNIIYENQSKVRNNIEKKDLSNKRQALGPTVKWVPEYRVRQNDFDEMKHALDNGSIVLKVMHTISLFGDSKREIDSICTSMQNYWNGKEMSFHRESSMRLPIFLQQIPLNANYPQHKNLGRYWTLPSRVAAHSLPMVSEYDGGINPAMIFSTRLGMPAFFDLYESQTSYSGLIIAESGSGKSVLSQYLIASYLAYRDAKTQGCRTWIIDIGYSYRRFCSQVGGAYVDFKDKDLVINPFEYVKTEEDYDNSKEMLLGIISVMAVPTETISDLQSSALREHLRSVWEVHKDETTIDLIAESMAKDEEPSVSILSRQIRPFTSRGDFGKFFNGKTNIDMNTNDFIVVELEGLRDSPPLQSAVLYLVMFSITQAVNGLPKDIRKNILVDEGWALINKSKAGGKDGVAEFLEGMYRTIRKKSGSCVFISQGIGDLTKTESGRAIADNSPNKFLLGQSASAVEKAKINRDIILDDYGWDLLKSVKTKRGIYSEIFVMQGAQYGVLRLAMSRKTVLLFTTEGTEVELLDAIERSGCSAGEAIDLFIEYEDAGRIGQLIDKYLQHGGAMNSKEDEAEVE